MEEAEENIKYNDKLQKIVQRIAYEQIEAEQVDDLFSKMGLLHEFLTDFTNLKTKELREQLKERDEVIEETRKKLIGIAVKTKEEDTCQALENIFKKLRVFKKLRK